MLIEFNLIYIAVFGFLGLPKRGLLYIAGDDLYCPDSAFLTCIPFPLSYDWHSEYNNAIPRGMSFDFLN